MPFSTDDFHAFLHVFRPQLPQNDVFHRLNRSAWSCRDTSRVIPASHVAVNGLDRGRGLDRGHGLARSRP